MSEGRIHYLEIVTSNVNQVCDFYSQTLGVSFSDAIPELGGARTANLLNGGTLLGVRAPLHETEEPTSRPYYLVSNIVKAVEAAKNSGAQVAVPPMEISGRGQCAVLMFGPIQSGLWQV
ncbi:VOC family protein [Glaciecola sp. KUL10]|jgi:predicted enzyme related to lactoylglutathione lyase|uniref:VOC family protein n=1 Tax=Glaciecola sp. (strain KUL10) TaxID=2161813 RepID=UPI000D78679B|nr:VOC family protein [Glaciecola sp. KUL10]GBL04325.1 hydroxylase [Glaciecola sp. KUL10]